MSCLRLPLPNALHHLPSSSKKAWNTFTSSLHRKLRHLHNHHLTVPNSITTATRRLLIDLRPKNRRQHRKRRPRGTHLSYSYNNDRYQYHHLQQSPATVYVDRLFSGDGESPEKEIGTTGAPMTTSGGGNMSVTWKEYVSSLPQIPGVDERAEVFISKFRQEIQLQREQSILDFQEMLARSS